MSYISATIILPRTDSRVELSIATLQSIKSNERAARQLNAGGRNRCGLSEVRLTVPKKAAPLSAKYTRVNCYYIDKSVDRGVKFYGNSDSQQATSRGMHLRPYSSQGTVIDIV